MAGGNVSALVDGAGWAPSVRRGGLAVTVQMREDVARWRRMGCSWDAVGRNLGCAGADARALFEAGAGAGGRAGEDGPVRPAALGPARRKVLRLVSETSGQRRDLSAAAGAQAPSLSSHLTLLKDEGLVVLDRDGAWRITSAGAVALAAAPADVPIPQRPYVRRGPAPLGRAQVRVLRALARGIRDRRQLAVAAPIDLNNVTTALRQLVARSLIEQGPDGLVVLDAGRAVLAEAGLDDGAIVEPPRPRARLLALLAGGTTRAGQIWRAMAPTEREAVRQMLHRLRNDGLVDCPTKGVWVLTTAGRAEADGSAA